MVRTYYDTTHLDIPFTILCPVYFLRYPNPLASHVISVDVLSREVVARPILAANAASSQASTSSTPLAGASEARGSGSSSRLSGWRFRTGQEVEQEEQVRHVLKTTRLILKRGTLPKWAPAGLVRNAESWVLEESEVDLDSSPSGTGGREMRCWTRNLDHTTVMAVTEQNVFQENSEQPMDAKDPKTPFTRLDSRYDIESKLSFGLLRNRIEKFGYNRVVTHVDTSREGILSTYTRFLTDRIHEGRLIGLHRLLHDQLVAAGSHQPPASKRARLLAALRPPFLDGDFVGPVARLRRRAQEVRQWWKGLSRGGTADREHMRIRQVSAEELEEQGERDLTPMERLRKRFLTLRDGPQLLHPTYNPAPGSDPSQG